MKTVDQLVQDVLRREGGYVNDPDDPGGATKYGVTIHTLRRLKVDIDGDGDVDVRDVKALDLETAARIYKRNYYEKPRIDQLPVVLQASVFDMYVNAGGNAIKILQRLLNEMGQSVTVDGALGPQSIGAARAAAAAAPDIIADAYGIARRNYYFRLADRRTASRKYARTRRGGKGGWIKRAEEFISPKYRMTEAEFQRRVAQWG